MAGTRGSGIGPAEQAYLDTLGAALWGRAPEALPANVEAVLQIANLHKTRPLILNALQKAGLDDLDDKTWSLIYKTASLHLTLNRYLVRLVAFFEQNGIKTVLLKGAGVAANYPEPVLRECHRVAGERGIVCIVSSFRMDKAVIQETVLPLLVRMGLPFVTENYKDFEYVRIGRKTEHD